MHAREALYGGQRRFALVSTSALLCGVAAAGLSASQNAASGSQTQLPATLEDFFEPGTQEATLVDPLAGPISCVFCHEFSDDGNDKQVVAPYDNWIGSLMAQAARDPVWHAALAIANQDLNMAGDTCIRCHSPNAWLGGRSVPTDASAFIDTDWAGVQCAFCHRMVDPVASSKNPPEDDEILAALMKEGLLPPDTGNARYIVDPFDARRGPLPWQDADGDGECDPGCPPDAVPQNFHGVPILVSPFHREGHFCGTCHDVSNSIFTRQPDGAYALNRTNAAHPTLNPHDMMPEQRTYSEWLNSAFATDGVYFADGRFGGDHPTGIMKSCQDCHMPKNYGGLCGFWHDPPFFARPDVAEHSFVGANTWVIGAVFDLYGNQSGLYPEAVDLNRVRTEAMLRAASDMHLQQIGNQLKVRIVNFSGHKLPTGYPEGRRLWLNAQFFDAAGALLQEYGGYDYDAATLDSASTKVYEMKLGMDDAVAQAAGLPAGESHHLVLNNVVLKDNRIPPIGFTNAAFEAVRAAPAAYRYADGQYWDDTTFAIPPGAADAVVTLYYQTSSREYMEFLRDTNVTNNAGQIAYDAWVARGKSAPLDMDVVGIQIGPMIAGDINHDGFVNVLDLLAVISAWGPCPPPQLCEADANSDGAIDVLDLLLVISNWG